MREKVKLTEEIRQIMDNRFGCDTILSLATIDGGMPYVRMVNSYYEDGAFYVITSASSDKMKQIAVCPTVAVCGEWFTGHGIGENIGAVNQECNAEIASKLRVVFEEWYDNGHVDENSPDTCILRIRLTDGVLFNHGTRYDIDFQLPESR